MIVIHAYDVSLSASKEREQQLQSQLDTVERESQDKEQQLSKLEDEIDGLHKKISVLEDQNEQHQEELKRLQQKSTTTINGLTSYSALICVVTVDEDEASYRLATMRCNKEEELKNENELVQDNCNCAIF